MTRPELRPLAQQLARAAQWDLEVLDDPVGVFFAARELEGQIRAVLASGWRPPAGQVGTVDELEALPVAAVVTDSDGQTWVRNRIGEWCEPYPAGIDPDELLADGSVTVQCIPSPDAAVTTASAARS
ncbi:hypothetical protein [Micromonospora sp.]|uniref:hypothetical protein n=1 Tax=Micromonospora sp. TaxID=1876 RepID=UPI003B3A5D14